MKNYKIEFFGWCHTEGHDKVWGYVSIGYDKHLYNFWGARGKRFSFKRYDNHWGKNTLADLARDKMRPGRKSGTYEKINPKDVMTIIPDFEEEFEKQLAMAKLLDNFHGEKPESLFD